VKVGPGPVFWWWCLLAFGIPTAVAGLTMFVIIALVYSLFIFGIVAAITWTSLALNRSMRPTRRGGDVICPGSGRVVLAGTAPVLIISLLMACFGIITDLDSRYLWENVVDLSLLSGLATSVAAVIAIGYERNLRYQVAMLAAGDPPLRRTGSWTRRLLNTAAITIIGIFCELAVLAATVAVLETENGGDRWDFLPEAVWALPVYSVLLLQSWLHHKVLSREAPGDPRANLVMVAISTAIQIAVLSVAVTVVFLQSVKNLG